MKKLLLLVLAISELFSLTISLNSAKENNTPYAILHIQDIEPLDCQIIPQGLEKQVYLCQFKKIVKAPIEAKKMKLVEIDFLEKEKEFFIKIEPKVYSKLIPVKTALYENPEVTNQQENRTYNHWTVLLYENMPFGDVKSMDGIDFPVIYPKEVKPYVGALDLNGAPISYAQSQDIKEYLDLKKLYEQKKYQDVIEDSLKAVKLYPETIFKSEMLLYRIKAIDAILDEEDNRFADNFDRSDVIKEAKEWTRTFSSNENLPEVLMIIAKSYIKMGQKSDANYFLDILISEHDESEFTKKAILLFADSLYNSRQQDRAIKLYKDVLYSAKDLDVAAEAAVRLVDKQVDNGKKEDAREYLLKVLNANEKYLLKDKPASYALADKLANKGLYDIAARVADVLYKDSKKTDDNVEKLARDVAVWYSKANEITPAYEKLQHYLSEYKNGEYESEIQETLDELFFELKETNETKLANYYDELIQKYQNKIGDKAVVEKAKLLLSQKKYKEVLQMQNALLRAADDNNTQINDIVNQAASALTQDNIEENNCLGAVKYIEDYKLEEHSFEANKVFECLIRSSRFIRAKELSEMKITSKDLDEKRVWLENYIISLYHLNQYSKVIEVSDDALKLSQIQKKKPNYESTKDIFFSYMREKKLDKALEIASLIEKNWVDDFKNSDIFNEIVKEATDTQDDLLLSKYAKKVIDLQNKHKKYVQTPMVEFNYINALKRLKKDKEALSVAKDLLQKKLEPKDMSRAFYYAAEVSLKLGDTKGAKEYFQKCSDAKEDNSWKDICVQNLKLLP